MTVLWFPWRPGACKLTFGPGNSLQLVGEATRLPLSMRVGSTAGGQAQLLFQRQAPSAVHPEGGRKLGKSLQQGCRWSCRTSAPGEVDAGRREPRPPPLCQRHRQISV